MGQGPYTDEHGNSTEEMPCGEQMLLPRDLFGGLDDGPIIQELKDAGLWTEADEAVQNCQLVIVGVDFGHVEARLLGIAHHREIMLSGDPLDDADVIDISYQPPEGIYRREGPDPRDYDCIRLPPKEQGNVDDQRWSYLRHNQAPRSARKGKTGRPKLIRRRK